MSSPWMKFYPRDWRGDQALRAVSIAARGLWMECLCIMHEARPYGHLVLNGKPVGDDALARMTGAPVDEVAALMAELRQAGAFSVTREGIIFSRRMTKDHARASKGRKAVQKRWAQQADNKEKSSTPNRAPTRDPTTQKPEARYQKEDVVSDETTSPEPGEPAPVAVIGLPTVSDGDFPIFDPDIAEWSSAFPGVDVRQQLAAMRQWLLANPTRRKTRRGMRKFVVAWLDRRQNAGPAPLPRATAPPQRERTIGDVLGEMAAGTWTGPQDQNREPDYLTIDTSFSRRN